MRIVCVNLLRKPRLTRSEQRALALFQRECKARRERGKEQHGSVNQPHAK